MTDAEIQRRAAALRAAREFLGKDAPVQEMMAVASWLMTGQVSGKGKYSPRQDVPKKATRQDVYAPGTWTRLDDGRWMSPKGHVYAEHTQVVQRVLRAQRQEEQRCADAEARPRVVARFPQNGTLAELRD